MKNSLLSLTLIVLISASVQNLAYSQGKSEQAVVKKMQKWENPLAEWKHIGRVRLDSAKQGSGETDLIFYFSTALSYYPLREDNIRIFRSSVTKVLGRKYRNNSIALYSNGFRLEELVPNIFRKELPVDSARIKAYSGSRKVQVRSLQAVPAEKGMGGRSIALWHSHGYYFEMNLDRWEWQRARLFSTVEDISVMGYVLPYLYPMLERAGANVYLPRERDIQVNEIIVDNDNLTGCSEVVIHPLKEIEQAGSGFMMEDTLFNNENPFRNGTSVRINGGSALYIPDITEDGYYYVSVSYPASAENCSAVLYSVNHSGGKSGFLVDQTIGGSTWLYLGKFHFRKGKNRDTGSVAISYAQGGSGYIGLDAVRFGGGMGNVARRPSPEVLGNQRSVNENAPPVKTGSSTDVSGFRWKLSGKPRFLEGSRYWLQYAGMPDTLVYSPNAYKNDYNDDYQSRGGWVNYIMETGIPLDLSLAFHTDAGITPGDSIIGTLGIYSTAADNGRFPDGRSRMASRDLSDIIQTQITADLSTLYNPEWTRRGLWDRSYSEARRPNVPAMLLELLSHQNLADQRFGLDPRFRYDVSRSVYKGMLKYLAFSEGRDYCVQPLPVKNFAINLSGSKKIRLSWSPTPDKLEPTAVPARYRVCMRISDNGFDNGFITENTSAEVELPSYDTIYSFKVTALNEGGESSDSEILSIGLKKDDTSPVLVVNGFDRICGPAWFDGDSLAGVAWWTDRGVADHFDISTVGDQYDYNRKSPWLDDDAPGWGASYADMEGKPVPGNSFDNTFIHGKSILKSGHSFYSVSDEYFCSGSFEINGFSAVDLVFGEERATPSFNNPSEKDFMIYTPGLLTKLSGLTEKGINIMITGAYIGSDLFPAGDSTAIKFASKYLHFIHRTGHAVNRGGVYTTDYALPFFRGSFNFNTGYSPAVYSVESPDAIEPSGKESKCVLRYEQTNASAGVAFRGSNRTFAMGFPFESIPDEAERDYLMLQIMNFFNK
jgi:hypothetical protein